MTPQKYTADIPLRILTSGVNEGIFACLSGNHRAEQPRAWLTVGLAPSSSEAGARTCLSMVTTVTDDPQRTGSPRPKPVSPLVRLQRLVFTPNCDTL